MGSGHSVHDRAVTASWKKILVRLCVGIVVVEVLFAYPLGYDFVLNSIGPSTEYLEPWLPTAKTVDGKPTVYIGNDFYVQHTIVRHALNGNCLLKIHRYAEDVDGPTPGKRHLIDYAELQFVGRDEILHPRWPAADDPYVLGYERDEKDNTLYDRPLLPDGVDQLTMDFYVSPRNFCNTLDYLIPRYTNGGTHWDESPRVRARVKRHRPNA